ncbi:hypothetical protein, partial [Rufibacter ruber]|uniref:hypothetical protein n=1 Tax=Rufibacter ruber TaxID=1783499 RepID=UPI0019D38DB1
RDLSLFCRFLNFSENSENRNILSVYMPLVETAPERQDAAENSARQAPAPCAAPVVGSPVSAAQPGKHKNC